MAQFRNLAELQKYLEQNTAEVLANSMDVERILANAVVDSVIENVYEAYPDPKEYVRRRNRGGGGLDDSRNYEISDIRIENGKIRLSFENLTRGDDNMKNEFITDLIENDKDPRWEKQGEWSEARPFMDKAQEYLRQNPQRLIAAVKSGLKDKGFKMK